METIMEATEENQIYRKIGKRYKPIGMFFDRDYLTDGLWYIRTKDHSKRTTNGSYIKGLFKMSEKPLCKNFDEYCDLVDVAEEIMEDKDFYINDNGWSPYDIVCRTIAILKKKSNEIKKTK